MVIQSLFLINYSVFNLRFVNLKTIAVITITNNAGITAKSIEFNNSNADNVVNAIKHNDGKINQKGCSLAQRLKPLPITMTINAVIIIALTAVTKPE